MKLINDLQHSTQYRVYNDVIISVDWVMLFKHVPIKLLKLLNLEWACQNYCHELSPCSKLEQFSYTVHGDSFVL